MKKLEPYQIEFLRGVEKDVGSCAYSVHLLPGVYYCDGCPIKDDPRSKGERCNKDRTYRIAVELLMEHEMGL